MELYEVCNKIMDKIYEEGSKMTDEEAEILKTNLDDPIASCCYALGLLMNSSCRFHYIFGFRKYDELQLEAFDLMNKLIQNEVTDAYFWMAEIKTGLFGKFPRNVDGAKELYERYYNATNDSVTKENVLDRWDEFLKEREERFNDLKFIEKYKAINPQNFDTSGHDDAYYESLSKKDEEN